MTNDFNHSVRTLNKGFYLGMVSLITFATISVMLGAALTILLLKVAAVVTLWVWLCRRFPVLGYFTGLFLSGFVAGLIGGATGSGYGWRYGRRW